MSRSVISVAVLVVALIELSTSITVKDCGSQSIRINHYKSSPEHIPFPGSIKYDADFLILRNISAPVDLKVNVKRKTWLTWLPIPCIKEIGSCTYHNGCERLKDLLVGKGCPQEVIDAGLSCECPIKAAHVRLYNKNIDVPKIDGFGSAYKGVYHVKAQLISPDTKVTHLCVEIEVELK